MDKIALPNPLPPEGVKIPLRAAFSGLKGMPLVALSHNSIAPLLRLSADSIEFRVIIQRKKSYMDIERVDAAQGFATQNLAIIWKDSAFAFVGNLGDADNLRTVLQFLQKRGVPLGKTAQRVLQMSTS